MGCALLQEELYPVRLSLEEQLRFLEEQIACEYAGDLEGKKITASFKSWRDQHRKISSDIQGIKKEIRNCKIWIRYYRWENRKLERIVIAAKHNKRRGKEADKARAYGRLLESEIIPRQNKEIANFEEEIRVKEYVLAGYSWKEARQLVEEPEPTLF